MLTRKQIDFYLQKAKEWQKQDESMAKSISNGITSVQLAEFLESIVVVCGGGLFNVTEIKAVCRDTGSSWYWKVPKSATSMCNHERLNDHGDACLDCGAVYSEGKWQ